MQSQTLQRKASTAKNGERLCAYIISRKYPTCEGLSINYVIQLTHQKMIKMEQYYKGGRGWIEKLENYDVIYEQPHSVLVMWYECLIKKNIIIIMLYDLNISYGCLSLL